MRRLLKIFGVLLLLVLAWLGLVLSEWLPRPTEAQLAAMAVLEPEPANVTGERNAFAATWLMGYDVPEAELETVTAADVAAFADAARRGPVTDFKSTAEGKYPAIPSPPGSDPLLCKNWGSDCLAHVRANTQASRERVAEFAKVLERADGMAKYDHYRYGFLPRWDSPIGGGASISLQLTATALDFVDGKVDAAFARVCRDTATWKRLRAHSDALIMDMLGVAQMSNAARLYAEMLAEQPAGFTPPCPDVFAPLADDEINQCATIRKEFQFLSNTIYDDSLNLFFADAGHRPVQKAVFSLVNRRHVVQASAPYFANQCGEENRERVRRRDPAPLPVDETPCGAMAWAFDPMGCRLAVDAMPAYNDYHQRVLDLDARLKLLQSALWLRAQPADGDRVAQFEARPDAFKSDHHAMTIDAERAMLRMVPLQKSKGAHWELPYAVK